MKNIQKKIKTIRQWRELSQQNMADELGVTQKAYSKFESGETKCDLERLLKIATTLKISFNDLIMHESEYIIYRYSNSSSIATHLNLQTESIYLINELERLMNSNHNEAIKIKSIVKKWLDS